MPTNRSADLRTFWPPCCPNRECPQADSPERNGFFRHGHYVTRTRGRRIPRFLCRACRRTMSSQTFNSTYRLRKPELENAILQELAQGASMRRVAEILGINRKTVSRRLMRVRRQTTPPVEAEALDLTAKAVADPGSSRETI
ncbi:MAG TPA: LuxR C-terminal-related transcriptional regulator [Candidatus Polarisedimenticolia bacterium]